MKQFMSKITARAAKLFAAFVPLADVKESARLSVLYRSDQDLVTYLNTIFKMAIVAGAILAVLRLVYAGYIYMGSDAWGNKERAKQMMRDVFLGILLLLSVYIILYQINPQLLNLKIAMPDAMKIPSAPPSYTVLPTEQRALDAVMADEQDVRRLLAQMNISVNKAPCTSVGQRNCTNVGGLGINGVSGLKTLKANCRECSVVVTGGTEWWNHSQGTAHQPGNSVVDIARNPGVDDYIMKNGKRSTTNTFIRGKTIDVYKLPFGTYYKEDGAHWHVVY